MSSVKVLVGPFGFLVIMPWVWPMGVKALILWIPAQFDQIRRIYSIGTNSGRNQNETYIYISKESWWILYMNHHESACQKTVRNIAVWGPYKYSGRLAWCFEHTDVQHPRVERSILETHKGSWTHVFFLVEVSLRCSPKCWGIPKQRLPQAQLKVEAAQAVPLDLTTCNMILSTRWYINIDRGR